MSTAAPHCHVIDDNLCRRPSWTHRIFDGARRLLPAWYRGIRLMTENLFIMLRKCITFCHNLYFSVLHKDCEIIECNRSGWKPARHWISTSIGKAEPPSFAIYYNLSYMFFFVLCIFLNGNKKFFLWRFKSVIRKFNEACYFSIKYLF